MLFYHRLSPLVAIALIASLANAGGSSTCYDPPQDKPANILGVIPQSNPGCVPSFPDKTNAVGNYSVTFQNLVYDSAKDITTFSYKVCTAERNCRRRLKATTGTSTTFNPKAAISHLVIPIEGSCTIVGYSMNEPTATLKASYGQDPTTCVTGLKLDSGWTNVVGSCMDPSSWCRIITVQVAGNVPTSEGSAAIKASTGFSLYNTVIPDCSAPICALPVSTGKPTRAPSATPSATPSSSPSANPTAVPSAVPSASPTAIPSASPSSNPTSVPSASPSSSPTAIPSASPSSNPTTKPSSQPSSSPTSNPTSNPSYSPSESPTKAPTASPIAKVDPGVNPGPVGNCYVPPDMPISDALGEFTGLETCSSEKIEAMADYKESLTYSIDLVENIYDQSADATTFIYKACTAVDTKRCPVTAGTRERRQLNAASTTFNPIAAISHITVDIDARCTVLSYEMFDINGSTSGKDFPGQTSADGVSQGYKIGTDPTSCVAGFKFDLGWSNVKANGVCGESDTWCRLISFTIAGYVPVNEDGVAAIKASTGFTIHTTGTPDCTPC